MSKVKRDRVYVYTDGGCKPNPGVGAAASILVFNGEIVDQIVNSKKDTTNNEMELAAFLQGVMLALKFISPINGTLNNKKLIVFCDSQYVVKGVNEWRHLWKSLGWRKSNGSPISNLDMWKSIDEVMVGVLEVEPGLKVKHVRAHNGNKFNEIVDNMCTQAINELI